MNHVDCDGRGSGAESQALELWLHRDGEFIAGASDPRVAQALMPHLKRFNVSSEHLALELPSPDGGLRKLDVQLREVLVGKQRTIAIALSERLAADAYRLVRFDLVLEATRDAVWEWVVADGSV